MDEKAEERPSGVAHGLRAFQHRDYAYFWLGALISNSGTWLQNLTLPFVLLEITGQATWAGIAAFASIFPSVLLGPLAGNIADRFDRRKVLIIGQSLAAAAALLLWIVWISGVREPAAIVAVAALGGIIGGFTIPTWQSFIPLLVPVEDLPSAITMNSLQFNAARAVGPAFGGALIALVGPAGAFLANALSFGAVVTALLIINPGATRQVKDPKPVIKGFVEAIRYIRTQPGIALGIAIAAVVASLGFPIITFVVVFARQVYEVDEVALGILSGLLGVGAILGVPLVSGMFGDMPRGSIIRFALPTYGLAVVVFGTSTSAAQGAVGLLLAGAAFISIVATSNTAVQSIVAEHIRGRVMATRIMTFTASYPIGVLIQTRLSDVLNSPRLVVTVAGSIIVVIGLALATKPAILARLDDPTDTSLPVA